jgi:hypothetical protein
MYFAHVISAAERPQTREEQLAYNTRNGELAARLRDLRRAVTAARRTARFAGTPRRRPPSPVIEVASSDQRSRELVASHSGLAVVPEHRGC